MSMILGFGSTEQHFEQQELDFVNEFLRERLSNKHDGYFTDEIAAELDAAIKERSDEYRRLDAEYETAEEYPSRYSYYYYSVLHDVSNICVVFNFRHINRRHPMSPDGWAIFGETKVCHADYYDVMDSVKESANPTSKETK